jgi:hypothetical protein
MLLLLCEWRKIKARPISQHVRSMPQKAYAIAIVKWYEKMNAHIGPTSVRLKIIPGHLIIGGLLIVSLLLVGLRFDTIPVGSFWDDAHYIILAESLSQGSGYRLINHPHAPLETAFPPGYPLLLVPFVTLFPQNFAVLKLVSLAFWLGTLALFYHFLKGRLASPYREGVALLVAVNPSLVGMATTVMSEPPFLFVTLLALVMLDGWRDRYDNGRSHWPHLVGGVLLVITAVFIRTIAITLLGALLLYLLYRFGRQHIKWLGVIVIFLLLLLIPLAWFNASRGGAGLFSPLYYRHLIYVSQNIGDLLSQWPQAIDLSLVIIADAIIPFFELNRFAAFVGEPLHTLLMSLVAILLLAGYVLSLRQGGVLPIYLLVYGGLLYFWVVYTEELRLRLLLPVLPFFYLYLALVAIWLVGQVGERLDGLRRQKRPLLTGAFILLLLISLARNFHEWQRPVKDRVVDLTAGVAWIQANIPPDAIVMSPNAIPEHLYYRRLTVYPPAAFEATLDKDIQAHLDQNNVDFIIVRPHLHDWKNPERKLDQFSQTRLVPFLTAQPDRYAIVYQDSAHNLTIYAVLRQG